MERALKVAAAAVGGFLVTSVAIVIYWNLGYDSNSCGTDCFDGLVVAAAAVFLGFWVGLACAFLAFVLTGRRPRQT